MLQAASRELAAGSASARVANAVSTGPAPRAQPKLRCSEMPRVLGAEPRLRSDQEPARSGSHSVTVPGRTSVITFRNPTRIGAAVPGRVVSRNTSGSTSTPDAVISIVQLRVEADYLIGQARVDHRQSSRATRPMYPRWTMSTVPAIAPRRIPSRVVPP
jgi:hypothetical protein